MNPILELRHVNKRVDQYKRTKHILLDISLTIYTNTSLAIIGPSGSGKTTLAKILKGYFACSSGEILSVGSKVNPKDLLKNTDIQLVFQNPNESLTPNRLIAGCLMEYLLKYKHLSKDLSMSRLHSLCAELQIHPSHLDKYPHQLSGGEMQRIALLRALLVDPKILICDEILSALDQPLQLEIMKTLMRYHKKKSFALLFISHDLSILSNFFKDVMVLDQGKVIQKGSLSEILSLKNNQFIAHMLISMILLASKLA